MANKKTNGTVEFVHVMNRRKGVDFMTAGKKLSDHVTEYGVKYVYGVTYKTRLKSELDALSTKKDTLIADDKIDAIKKNTLLTAILAEEKAVVKKYDALIEKQGKYEKSDADNALYKAYKSAETTAQFYNAVVAWFRAYGLDVNGKNYPLAVCDAFGGLVATSTRHVVNDNKWTTSKRTSGQFFKVFYGMLIEDLGKSGLIKLPDFPEDIRAKYAPKKRTK